MKKWILKSLLVIFALSAGASIPTTEVQASEQLQVGKHILKLPNGQTVYSDSNTFTYENLQIQLQTIGAVKSTGAFSVANVMGNHAELVKEEDVQLPQGVFTYGLVKRTEPAASMSDKVTMEHWLVGIGPAPDRPDMIWAYTMIVKGTGDESAIKTKMLQLAKNWQLPVTPNK